MKSSLCATYIIEMSNRPNRFVISCLPSDLMRVLDFHFPDLIPGTLKLLRIAPDQAPADAIRIHGGDC